MTTTRFEPVRLARRKDGTCSICGRATVRSTTFEQTVNPYNRTVDGRPKTPRDIWDELVAEADAWEPDFRHAKCKTGGEL